MTTCSNISSFPSTRGKQCLLEAPHLESVCSFKPVESMEPVNWKAYWALNDALTFSFKGKVCRECQSEPRIVGQDPRTTLRRPGLKCNCEGEPILIAAEHPVAERYRTMTNQQVARLEPDEHKRVSYISGGREITITANVVRELFCPKATDIEAFAFLKFCEYNALNPYLREAYIIKYDASKPAQIVIGKMGYTSRAQQQAEYAGMEDGIIVGIDNEELDIPGTLIPRGADLLGGWAKVYRNDRRVPTIKRVSLGEYNKPQSNWKDKPATMINKVAIVQATREAFSAMFAKLENTSEIIGVAGVRVVADTGEIMDDESISAPAFDEPTTGPGVDQFGVPHDDPHAEDEYHDAHPAADLYPPEPEIVPPWTPASSDPDAEPAQGELIGEQPTE